ncbi:hypothetical protein VNO77_20214 [Canavalia gladiata]|uniref:Uncharacterized protein n=1 Tax=Canavalia gladiata TaxID=3824 RepID=A0AAN9LNW0_CANGL
MEEDDDRDGPYSAWGGRCSLATTHSVARMATQRLQRSSYQVTKHPMHERDCGRFMVPLGQGLKHLSRRESQRQGLRKLILPTVIVGHKRASLHGRPTGGGEYMHEEKVAAGPTDEVTFKDKHVQWILDTPSG